MPFRSCSLLPPFHTFFFLSSFPMLLHALSLFSVSQTLIVSRGGAVNELDTQLQRSSRSKRIPSNPAVPPPSKKRKGKPSEPEAQAVDIKPIASATLPLLAIHLKSPEGRVFNSRPVSQSSVKTLVESFRLNRVQNLQHPMLVMREWLNSSHPYYDSLPPSCAEQGSESGESSSLPRKAYYTLLNGQHRYYFF